MLVPIPAQRVTCCNKTWFWITVSFEVLLREFIYPSHSAQRFELLSYFCKLLYMLSEIGHCERLLLNKKQVSWYLECDCALNSSQHMLSWQCCFWRRSSSTYCVRTIVYSNLRLRLVTIIHSIRCLYYWCNNAYCFTNWIAVNPWVKNGELASGVGTQVHSAQLQMTRFWPFD